jgi:hypothetical protein
MTFPALLAAYYQHCMLDLLRSITSKAAPGLNLTIALADVAAQLSMLSIGELASKAAAAGSSDYMLHGGGGGGSASVPPPLRFAWGGSAACGRTPRPTCCRRPGIK